MIPITKRPKILAIYGPTVSNKTGLAVNLAKWLWGRHQVESELVSMDSRKIYKELTAGQSLLTSDYEAKIPYHMTGFLTLDEEFGLYDYKQRAEEIIGEIIGRGNLPILVGGGGIQHLSIIENWNLPKEYKGGVDHKKKFGKDELKYNTLILVPSTNRKVLGRAIERHVNKHFGPKLVDEVAALSKKYDIDPLDDDRPNILWRTIWYREFLEYSRRNKCRLDQLRRKDLSNIKRRIIKDHKELARKQLMYLKKFPSYVVVEDMNSAREEVAKFLEGSPYGAKA